jgi:signal transduction histidine kinase
VRLVLERALDLTHGQFGQLMLTEGTDLVVHYTTNDPPRDVGLRMSLGSSLGGLAVQERAPVIVPDVNQPDYCVVQLATLSNGSETRSVSHTLEISRYQRILERERERIRAELVVPLWQGDQIQGILNVETARTTGFSEKQRQGLSELGRQCGGPFVEALYGGDKDTLRRMLDEALLLTDTAYGQLMHLEGDSLTIVATTGGEPEGTKLSVSDSVSGHAVLRRAEYYVENVESEPLYRRYLGEEMKSALLVPLISREQAIGVINLESAAPGFFTVEHARVLQALAVHAAIAIERARRTEVERLAAIGGLAGDIIHRLNNPIGALGGWVEMLQRKPFFPEITERYPYISQYVARAEHDINRAKAIIQELRSELKPLAPVPLDLHLVVHEALLRAGLLHGQRSIQVAVSLPPEPFQVLGGSNLAAVFWNLFDNARKAMPEGGTLSISAGPVNAEGFIDIDVADTGIGIEPWRLPTIFDAGASTTADVFAPAHGLGLWWTRAQIESYGGDIDITSQPGQGTTVTVRLRAAS